MYWDQDVRRREVTLHYTESGLCSNPTSHQRLLWIIEMLFCSGRNFPSLRGTF